MIPPTSNSAARFGLKLNWTEEDITDLISSLDSTFLKYIDRHEELPQQKTSGALLRLVLALQIGKNGFGAPGRICLKNRKEGLWFYGGW